MKTTVYERISMLRKHLNLSQTEFGSRIKATLTTVSRLENGGSEPRISTLNKIIDEFGVSKEWLLHGTGEMTFETVNRESEKGSSWKEKAFEELEKRATDLEQQVLFYRQLLLNLTGKQAGANFNQAIDLAGLFPEKFVGSVRVAA